MHLSGIMFAGVVERWKSTFRLAHFL